MDKKTKSVMKEILSYILIILVVVLIRTYVGTPIKVSGSSMKPTLNGSEIMILNKLDKKFTRNEVVVVKTKHGDIIKRVIALPGETISVEDGKIYINSRKVEDKFGYGTTNDFEKIELKDDEYFCMGDNREDSMDSRYYGPFKKDVIKGSTKFIIFPIKRIGNIK